jgi:hypothetical protein
MPNWTFLSNHGQVLLCIAHDPGGGQVGITERAAHLIVGELVDAGYLERERKGRRNHYAITTHRGLPDPLARESSIGDLLNVLVARP